RRAHGGTGDAFAARGRGGAKVWRMRRGDRGRKAKGAPVTAASHAPARCACARRGGHSAMGDQTHRALRRALRLRAERRDGKIVITKDMLGGNDMASRHAGAARDALMAALGPSPLELSEGRLSRLRAAFPLPREQRVI